MQVQVEGISHRGEGVARMDGKAVFVPYAIPGEEVQIEIAREYKRFARGRLLEICSASPDREEPACPAYYHCGGCAYQHVKYAKEIDFKRRVVRDTLKRLGGIDVEVLPVIGIEDPWRYRNKVVWHTAMVNGKMELGFYRENSHDLIPLHGCTLIHKDMEKVQKSLADNLSEIQVEPGSEFSLRRSFWTRCMSLVLRGNCNKEAFSAWACSFSDQLSVHVYQDDGIQLLHGSPFLEEHLCGLIFSLIPWHFSSNHQQTEKLYKLGSLFCWT